jgi:hypothetical protein
VSPDLIPALKQLPSSYQNEPGNFNDFFSKFGSHFVSRVKIGGALKIDFKVQKGTYDTRSESSIEAAANGIYKYISMGGSFSTEAMGSQLQSVGVSETSVTFTGGNPPMVTCLSDLTPQVLQEWIRTVESDPAELQHSFSLYPYYNLSQCAYPSALREATMSYLEQSLKNVISKRREEIAKKAQEEATSVDNGSKCFPGSTMVRTTNGASKMMSELSRGDKLATVKLGNASHRSAPFYTFLHKEVNIRAQFICFTFSNQKSLRATSNHLLLIYQESNGKLQSVSVLAGSIEIGDVMLYVDEEGNISYPEVVGI